MRNLDGCGTDGAGLGMAVGAMTALAGGRYSVAGLASARARGRVGGRAYKMTVPKLRIAIAAMGKSKTRVSELCTELGITRQTLYRHVSPSGKIRPDGTKLLAKRSQSHVQR